MTAFAIAMALFSKSRTEVSPNEWHEQLAHLTNEPHTNKTPWGLYKVKLHHRNKEELIARVENSR